MPRTPPRSHGRPIMSAPSRTAAPALPGHLRRHDLTAARPAPARAHMLMLPPRPMPPHRPRASRARPIMPFYFVQLFLLCQDRKKYWRICTYIPEKNSRATARPGRRGQFGDIRRPARDHHGARPRRRMPERGKARPVPEFFLCRMPRREDSFPSGKNSSSVPRQKPPPIRSCGIKFPCHSGKTCFFLFPA